MFVCLFVCADDKHRINKSQLIGPTVEIDSTSLAALPVLGRIDASSLESPCVSLPDLFSGDSISGKIWLKNGFTSALQIQGLSASCGCTDAFIPKGTVPPKEKTPVVVNVTPTKVGDYSISVRVQTSKGVFDWSLKGKILPRITIALGNSKFDEDLKCFFVPFALKDSRLKSKELAFASGSDQLRFSKATETNGSLIIPVSDDEVKVVRRVVPIVGDEELKRVDISLVVPDRFGLDTREIVLRDRSFILSFLGECGPSVFNRGGLRISQGTISLPLKFTKLEKDGGFVLRCKFPDQLSRTRPVTILVRETPFVREVIEL